MQRVADILRKKGNHVESIAPDTPVIKALELMRDKNYGSVVIMENGHFLGIMTERDYSRKVILQGKNSTDTKVSEIMSTSLPNVGNSTSIDECMKLMTEKNIRYLPVFDQKNLIGIISMTDVVWATIYGQKQTINHLEQYIRNAG